MSGQASELSHRFLGLPRRAWLYGISGLLLSGAFLCWYLELWVSVQYYSGTGLFRPYVPTAGDEASMASLREKEKRFRSMGGREIPHITTAERQAFARYHRSLRNTRGYVYLLIEKYYHTTDPDEHLVADHELTAIGINRPNRAIIYWLGKR